MTDAAARVHRRARERGGVAGGGAGAAGRPGAAHRRAHAGPETDPVRKTRLSTLTQGLAALGWIDGRNLRMDVRWTGGDTNRIRAFAQELVGLQPDIILTNATVATVALPMAATCGWTFAGAAVTPIGYERSRRSWSACNPTSF